MSVPYMGSKRTIAGKIYRAINNRHDKGLLVDLFCGGFAISEEFIKGGWNVIANDANKYVIALIRAVLYGDEWLEEQFRKPEFITRDKFYDIINNPDKYSDVVVGYVQCLWSFGNAQKDYLFGKYVEPIKRVAHEYIVNGNRQPFVDYISSVGLQIPEKVFGKIDRIPLARWSDRRLTLQGYCRARGIKNLKNEKQLQQLQQLEQLEQLQRLERLSAKDYRLVDIPDGAVVYCDPPYADTAKYGGIGFDNGTFWRWAEGMSKTNPVYVSEYTAPDGWTPILSTPKRKTLQGGNGEIAIERLYVYTGRNETN